MVFVRRLACRLGGIFQSLGVLVPGYGRLMGSGDNLGGSRWFV